MADKNSPRSMNEIQQDYANVCGKLGQVEYQIYVLKQDADMMKSSLKDLNFEGAAAKRIEDEVKAKVDAASPKSPTLAAVPEVDPQQANASGAV